MINPHRVALLANLNKSFTDQGLVCPPSLFKYPEGKKKKGKPLSMRHLRAMARGTGTSMSEREARYLMAPEKKHAGWFRRRRNPPVSFVETGPSVALALGEFE